MATSAELCAAILRDPSASFWLKNAIRDTVDRDCVDAANDAETLSHILSLRAQEDAAMSATIIPVRRSKAEG